MAGISPVVRVDDMAKALDFYTGTLGFDLRRGGPDEEHCGLMMGENGLMLEKPAAFYSPAYNQAIRDRLKQPGAMALYIETEDVDRLSEHVQAAGGKVVDPIADRPWGQREFTVEDPWGNWLTFYHASHAHPH